ncbi:MAG: NADH-quinone oxidoreductase subunit L [Trueperaceae bacterium]
MNGTWSDPVAWATLAPLFALAGALANGLFGRRWPEPLPGIVAGVAVAAAFAVSAIAFVGLIGRDAGVALTLWSFLPVAGLDVSVGVVVDALSTTFLLVITGVGLLIHVYSVDYMRDDEDNARYFALLNLFVASMLVLVLADSLVLLFVGWEGVGVCSYLLIGFWFRKKANADAGRKAFIVNRIGDAGFVLASFLVAATFGTLTIAEVNAQAGTFAFGAGVLTTIGLLYLVAATGKSAQFPLHVWLPDAMAGPTPVSALIHAATMVTAGIYLIARLSPLYAQAPAASAVVAWVGVLTALIAAIAALAQTDIKRILAYSTISQLGFMFVAIGVGAYAAAVFHVFTHAFFKALLFLAAGSVIHALHGEQDVRRMGGLGRRMKLTGTTALIGTLAISGVPLLSGFFSKEAILGGTWNSTLVEDYGSRVLFVLLLATAGLTAFYMFRWYHRVFAGPSRLTKDAAAKVHESSSLMTVPLVLLAAFAALAGFLGLPSFAFPNWFKGWLAPALAQVPTLHPPLWVEWLLVLASIVVAAAGLFAGWWIYERGKGAIAAKAGGGALGRFAEGGLGFDAAYRAAAVGPAEGVAGGLAIADRDLLDRGIAAGVTGSSLIGRAVAAWQSGYVRLYALAMFLGLAALAVVAAVVGGRP